MRRGFTVIELMVVILIVGILTAATVPMVRGRLDSAKWTEAQHGAGSIKAAVRTYITDKGVNYTGYSEIEGSLGPSGSIYSSLNFTSTGLDGSYFNQKDYTISNVNPANATCVVRVRSSHKNGPSGTGILAADGSWSVSDSFERAQRELIRP